MTHNNPPCVTLEDYEGASSDDILFLLLFCPPLPAEYTEAGLDEVWESANKERKTHAPHRKVNQTEA